MSGDCYASWRKNVLRLHHFDQMETPRSFTQEKEIGALIEAILTEGPYVVYEVDEVIESVRSMGRHVGNVVKDWPEEPEGEL